MSILDAARGNPMKSGCLEFDAQTPTDGIRGDEGRRDSIIICATHQPSRPVGRGAGAHQRCLGRDVDASALNLETLSPLTSRPFRAGRELSRVRLRLRGNSRSLRSLGGTAAPLRSVGFS